MPKIIVTGDKSRYQFLRSITERENIHITDFFFTENMEKEDIILTSAKDEKGENIYFSSKVPLNTRLIFPKEFSEESKYYVLYGKILYFDEFPFATDEEFTRFETMLQCNPKMEIVLFENSREALDSDVTTEEMALKEAMERYRSRNVRVTRYSPGEALDFLYCSVRPDNPGYDTSFRFLLKEARRMMLTFDSMYEWKYECHLSEFVEDIRRLNILFRYDRRLRNQNVWEFFCRKALQIYWKNTDKTDIFVKDVYTRNIEYISVWNIKEDVEDLKKCVRQFFWAKLMPSETLIYTGEEEEYGIFMNRNLKKTLAFKNKLINFFREDLKKYIKDRILRDMERMEKILNEKC